jgi:hypothetical protein
MELGKWFRGEDYSLPSFISDRSFQRTDHGDRDGWTFNKRETYPDMWINPKDSVVLTIKGQELVVSDEYSAGLTMRFPKIKKVRLDSVDGDEKKAEEVDSNIDIWDMFFKGRAKVSEPVSETQQIYGDPESGPRARRFLTPEEFGRKHKKRGRRNILEPSRKVPRVCLNGFIPFFLHEMKFSSN